jgi:ATP-dependent DNA ligase
MRCLPRPAVLLAYYDPDGRLVYAGRAGTGIDTVELQRLWRRLQPLAIEKMPLDVPPPRGSRFGSPLRLSRVHWVPALLPEGRRLRFAPDQRGDDRLRVASGSAR